MPIRPFLSNQAFEPETIMSLAYEEICKALGLKLTDNSATRVVAEKIIQYAQRGVRDAATLREVMEKEFNIKK